MPAKHLLNLSFLTPTLILVLAFSGFLGSYHWLYLIAIAIGLIKLVIESIEKIHEGRWSLDYIAMLAMATSLYSIEYYLAGAIIAFMITLSGALESFGVGRAEASLEALLARLPKEVKVKQGSSFLDTPIHNVQAGSTIFVKSNELIPLDGFLKSPSGVITTANLTGESTPIELKLNDFIKSGSINSGSSFELETSGTFETSSYQKIVKLVEESRRHPAPLVRLAQTFNWPFTAVALIIAGATYVITGEMSRTIAVLAIATPCPLLISAPIAFLGGMSKAAKKAVIIKAPSVIESLAGATTLFFDKTGTLTFGEPKLVSTQLFDKTIDEAHALVIAAAIEMHSLHPIARAFTSERARRSLPERVATSVTETIGSGINGVVDSIRYTITKSSTAEEYGIALDLVEEDRILARFVFADELKESALITLDTLKKNYKISILTGDSESNAQRLLGSSGITIHAHMTPQHKYELVKQARERGERVVMIGDGLNDAPALALADAGIVFSGTENSASIEAAKAAILHHDIALVAETLALSCRATRIARQSIIIGIGLSIIGMVFAGFGFITPVIAATIQELIDVGVTINALRASR